MTTPRPRVIVDFQVDHDDALMVVIRNVGDRAAARIRVRFAPRFTGMGGEVVIPRLALFRRLDFLAPNSEIRALVDPLAGFLARIPPEPRIIRVTIAYRDLGGRRFRTRIRHNLSVWEDLPRKR